MKTEPLVPFDQVANNVVQIGFLSGGFNPLVNKKGESDVEPGSDEGLTFNFTMKTDDVLDPVHFAKKEKMLTKKQADNMKFLDHGNAKNMAL